MDTDQLQQHWAQNVEPRVFETSQGPVLLRPVGLETLVLNGELPFTVLQDLDDARAKTDKPAKKKRDDGEDAVELIKLTRSMDAVVVAAVVSPKLSLEPEDGAILIHNVDAAVRQEIFVEVNRPVERLKRFPKEPAGSADSSRSGDGVPPAAE